MVNCNTWGYVSSSEDLKRTIWEVIAGIVIIIVGVVGASTAAGVGNYIIQALNRSGFTIPASANYVAPIESLAGSACLIVRTLSRLPVVIGIMLAFFIATIATIVALLRVFSGIGT